MNRFIRKSLEEGEEIVYNGRLHWSCVAGQVLGAWVLVALGVLAIVYSLNMQGALTVEEQQAAAGSTANYLLIRYLGFVILLSAIGLRLWARLQRTRTEFVITRSRLIQKDGILSIHMTEIPLYKVESVEFNQTLMERMLGTGSVRLTGSGGTEHVLNRICEPMAVRQAIAQCLKDSATKEQPKQELPKQELPAEQTPIQP